MASIIDGFRKEDLLDIIADSTTPSEDKENMANVPRNITDAEGEALARTREALARASERIQEDRNALLQQRRQLVSQQQYNQYNPWIVSNNAAPIPMSMASTSLPFPNPASLLGLRGILTTVASKIHNETGPAVYLEGGKVLYFWRGVHVPGWLVTNPERITPKRILCEANIEIRRIMLERYGIGRFLVAFDAKEIHRDKRGTLWEIDPNRVRDAMLKTRVSIGTTALDLLDGQLPIRLRTAPWLDPTRRVPVQRPLRFVQVKDGSSEREYFMGVPRKCKTATEAVAWTFGMTAEEYDERLKEEA